jgi:hypothetical protein
MPAHRLLDNTAFQPAEVEAMAQAFEASCHLKQRRPESWDPVRIRMENVNGMESDQ